MTQLTHRIIIDIAHGQWLSHNFTLHNNTNGYLLLQKKEEILSSITQLADGNLLDIPVESQFLLEIDPSNVAADSLLQQEYWVAAMKAALVVNWWQVGRSLCWSHQPSCAPLSTWRIASTCTTSDADPGHYYDNSGRNLIFTPVWDDKNEP